MSKLKVLTQDGKKGSEIDLPDHIFGGRVKSELLHQAVIMYQACLRQGNASTKERAEVSGGGKKPFRQKGTGRARQGSIRAPHYRGGGVVFGPQPRDFGYSIPKKIKKAALRESLNAKYHDENLHCIEDLKKEFSKTKEFASLMKTIGLNGKTLAVLDSCDPSIIRATRNLARFSLVRSQDVNAYDILRNKNLLISKSAIQSLIDRINGEFKDDSQKEDAK